MTHKSDDYKLNAVDYYLTEDKSQEEDFKGYQEYLHELWFICKTCNVFLFYDLKFCNKCGNYKNGIKVCCKC